MVMKKSAHRLNGRILCITDHAAGDFSAYADIFCHFLHGDPASLFVPLHQDCKAEGGIQPDGAVICPEVRSTQVIQEIIEMIPEADMRPVNHKTLQILTGDHRQKVHMLLPVAKIDDGCCSQTGICYCESITRVIGDGFIDIAVYERNETGSPKKRADGKISP